jgi:hypothetical protein
MTEEERKRNVLQSQQKYKVLFVSPKLIRLLYFGLYLLFGLIGFGIYYCCDLDYFSCLRDYWNLSKPVIAFFGIIAIVQTYVRVFIYECAIRIFILCYKKYKLTVWEVKNTQKIFLPVATWHNLLQYMLSYD